MATRADSATLDTVAFGAMIATTVILVAVAIVIGPVRRQRLEPTKIQGHPNTCQALLRSGVLHRVEVVLYTITLSIDRAYFRHVA